MNDEKDSFPEHMVEYTSKCVFIKKLFWSRIQHALRFVQIDDKSTILDIGCNTGHLLKEIRKINTRCKCWGTDIEPRILSLKINDCEFKVADARNLPFDNEQFTIVFALDVLEHVEDVDKAIDEIQRILKAGGLVILSGPTESLFYRFCRFLSFGTFSKDIICDKPGFQRGSDLHFHTVHGLEEKFTKHGFKKTQSISIPRKPFPELFRVTKFINYEKNLQ